MSSSTSAFGKAALPLIDDELSDLEQDLRSLEIGRLHLTDLADLSNTSDFDVAVPILLEHLNRPYSDSAKWTIAAMLGRKTPAVENAWPVLVKHFRQPDPLMKLPLVEHSRPIFKQALANALVKSYTNERFEEMVELIRNVDNGEPRFILVSAFKRRLRNPEVYKFLLSLIGDPAIAPELEAWGISKPSVP